VPRLPRHLAQVCDRFEAAWNEAGTEEPLTGHEARISGLTFSPDGRRLVGADEAEGLKVWDTATWQELQSLRGVVGPVAVEFSPDGLHLALHSRQDKSLLIFDAGPAAKGK
jgi:WD40 repeat protein